MSLWALASLSGSPGVSTTALAMAATCRRRALLVEADPFGSALAPRFGLSPSPGLATLAASRLERGPEAVFEHAQVLPGGLEVLVGLPSIAQAPALEKRWEEIAGALAATDAAIVIDAGRLLHGAPAPQALLRRAGALVVLARAHLEDVQRLRAGAGLLHQLNANPGLAVIGTRPYRPGEVADAAGLELWGSIAQDPPAAGLLAGRRGIARSLTRSALLRSVAPLLLQLERRGESAPVPGAPAVLGGDHLVGAS